MTIIDSLEGRFLLFNCMFICVYQNNTFHPDSQENSIVFNYIVYFTEVYHPNTCYSGFMNLHQLRIFFMFLILMFLKTAFKRIMSEANIVTI